MPSLWLNQAPPIDTDPWPPQPASEVIVVGGGITGVTSALMLAQTGRQVTLLEARVLGATTTGNSTGKASVLHATKASHIARRHGTELAHEYVRCNREALAWLRQFGMDHAVPMQEKKAVTWTDDVNDLASIRAERDYVAGVGLDAYLDSSYPELPFATVGGVTVPGQIQFNPMDLLAALANEFRRLGGRIHVKARVHGVDSRSHQQVHVNEHTVNADYVVIATGMPILDRGLHAARLEPHRSYCLAWSIREAPPDGMYISASEPVISLRGASHDDQPMLIVGGHGHPVGRTDSERRHLDQLRDWTRRYFGGAREICWWSAQDPRPASLLPHVSVLPMSGDRVIVATAFDKWGITNGVAAARIVTDMVSDAAVSPYELDWVRQSRSLPRLARTNVAVGAHLGAGHLQSRLSKAPESVPEGTGTVGRDPAHPAGVVAVSQVDGRQCTVSAVCTHLGGVVAWNDAERSWDCPLHGSRFAPDGAVLEGPATRPLRPIRTEDTTLSE